MRRTLQLGLLALALAWCAPAHAATVTHAVTTADTTPDEGGTGLGILSGAFTPAVDDLLCAAVTSTAAVDGGSHNGGHFYGTYTDSQSGTWSKTVAHTIYDATSKSIGFACRNTLITSATSTTVTFSFSPGDVATGAVIAVYRISGMTRTGANAIRQVDVTNNITATVAPTATFNVAALTGNPTFFIVGIEDAAPSVDVPSGWTEGAETGHSTPTNGMETAYRDSGFTGTTITAAATETPDHGVMIVELDTSSPPTAMDVDVFVDMDVADANGTTLTTTILNNGTNNIGSGTWAIGFAGAAMTVEAHRQNRLGCVTAGATEYAADSTSRAIRLDHDLLATEQIEFTVPSGNGAITVAGWIEPGPNDNGDGLGELYDLISFWDDSSAIFVVLQLNNGSANELETDEYALYIHTDGTDSPTFVILPDTRHWYTLTADYVKGFAHLSLYDTSGNLEATLATPFATAADVGRIEWGNGQTGTSAGQDTYFEAHLMDYDGAFPLGPGPAGTCAGGGGGAPPTMMMMGVGD